MMVKRSSIYGIIAGIAYSYNVINILMYCFGMHERAGMRLLVFWGGLCFIACAIIIAFIKNVLSRISKGTLIITITILGLTVPAILFSGRKGVYSVYIDNMLVYMLISVPMLFAGVLVGQRRCERSFEMSIDRISFLVIPASLYYVFGRLTGLTGTDFGFISYMVFAFTILPFLMIKIIKITQKNSKKIWDVITTVLFLTAILLSGTRSAYVTILTGLIALIIVRRKQGRSVGIIAAAILFILVFTWFNLCIWTIPGFEAINRFRPFLKGLLKGELVTSYTGYSNGYTTESIHRMADSLVEHGTGGLYLANRGTLFILAIKEFLKSPLFGMGPMQYTIKYGIYPHNVYLETIAETGIIGFMPLCLITVSLLIRGWRGIGKFDKHGVMFVLAVCAMTKSMMSGNIWTSSALYFFTGYFSAIPLEVGICHSFPLYREKEEGLNYYELRYGQYD